MSPIPFPELEKIIEPQAPAAEQAVAWWWWVGAAVLALIVLVLVAWGLAAIFRRASLPAAPVRPEKVALREVRALRKRATQLSAPEFGAALSGIVRTYLHRRTGMLARYATTPEILGTTAGRRAQVPPPPPVKAFAGVLEACDAMKFASGGADNRDALLSAAEDAIRSVGDALRHGPELPPAPPPPLADPSHAPAS
jgi:hypothetical protein